MIINKKTNRRTDYNKKQEPGQNNKTQTRVKGKNIQVIS